MIGFWVQKHQKASNKLKIWVACHRCSRKLVFSVSNVNENFKQCSVIISVYLVQRKMSHYLYIQLICFIFTENHNSESIMHYSMQSDLRLGNSCTVTCQKDISLILMLFPGKMSLTRRKTAVNLLMHYWQLKLLF